MMISTYGLMAASALAANAFIIPSTMSLSSERSEEISSNFWAQSPAYHGDTIMLKCTGCSWPSVDASSLALNFSLSYDSKDILLNGQPLYGSTPKQTAVVVPQIPSDASLEELEANSHSVPVRYRQLSFLLGGSTIDAADESTVKLVDLRLRVHSVDDESVQLNLVGLRVLKDMQETLRIMDVGILPTEALATQASQFPDEAGVNGALSKQTTCLSHVGPAALICHLRKFMAERLPHLHDHWKKPQPCSSHKHSHHTGHKSTSHHPAEAKSPKSWKSHMDDSRVMVTEFLHGLSHVRPQKDSHKASHMHHGAHSHSFCLRKVFGVLKHVIISFIIPVLAAFFIGWVVGMVLVTLFISILHLLGLRRHSPSLREDPGRTDVNDEEERFLLSHSLEDQAVSKQDENEDPPAYSEKISPQF